MKVFKKHFAIILCFALLLCTAPMGICAADTYDTVPAMPESEDLVVIGNGAAFSGTFGSTAITTQGHMPGYSPAQETFAAGSVAYHGWYEFDFYLDNISIIAARNTKLYLNLRSGSGNGDPRGLFEYQDQITASGWNHIIVKTDLADNILEILTMARFYIDIDAGQTGASDHYRIANICATVADPYREVPAMTESEDMFVIGDGAVIQGVLGSLSLTGKAHLPGYSGETPAEVIFSNPGLAWYDYFEFDYYTDDIANFRARAVKLYFDVRTITTSQGTFEFDEQITQSGWNHVKIAADLDGDILNSITKTRFYMDIYAGSKGETNRYRIANICATVADPYNEVPAMTESENLFVIGDGAVIQGVLGSSPLTGKDHLPGYNKDRPAEVIFSNPGLAAYDYFEFDCYVEDIDNFNARNTKLYLNVRANPDQSKGSFEFDEQIEHSGWNHVKIAADLDSDILNSITKTRFYMDIDAGATGETDRYRIANICATAADPYGEVPAMPESEDLVVIGNGARFQGVLGSSSLTGNDHLPGYNKDRPAEVIFSNPGLAAYDYFEFDCYVEDIDNFNARNTKLYLNVRANPDQSKGSFEFDEQIEHSGWNHVKITAALSSNDLNSIAKARYYMDIDAGETGATDSYRIANICATKDTPFRTKSLVLAEAIGVNFLLDLSGLSADEKASSYMTFAISHTAKENQTDFSKTFRSGSKYGFTCFVSSVQMAETITPTFHYTAGGVEQTYTGKSFSVKAYIDYVVENSGSFPRKVVDLVKALGDYGHYAQIYLGGRNSWSSGTDYTAISRYRAADYDGYSTYLSALSSDALAKSIEDSAVTGVSYSLNFDTSTYVNVQLATTDSLIASATVDGKTLYLSSSGKFHTQGLPILKLGTPIVITGRGTSKTTTFTVTLSGLSYIRAILNGSTTPAAKNAVAALYDYYTAARIYKGVR